MIYYCADLHFDYEAILEQTGRPFSTISEMNEALIENWNKTVTEEDVVYFVGDMGCHSSSIPDEYLSRLNGHKHLIRGNHDTGLEDQQRLFRYFESITDFLEIDDEGVHITLCHYPIIYIQRGYMIHGHLHNTKKELYEILKQLPRVMNAGVDVNQYKPVTLDELIHNNQLFYENPERGQRTEWSSGHEPCKKHKWKASFLPLPIKK